MGRVVAFDTRDPRFKSGHQQILLTINCIEKTKIKKKRLGIAHLERYTIQSSIYGKCTSKNQPKVQLNTNCKLSGPAKISHNRICAKNWTKSGVAKLEKNNKWFGQ